jgi:uncharacterized protein YkwD
VVALIVGMATLVSSPLDATFGDRDASAKPRSVHAPREIRLQAREEALRDAVNAERRRNGLAPLAIDPTLQRDARAHTADMIRFGYFGHEWHDGRSFRAWILRRTTCDTMGEILAWSSPQQTPDHAVRQWLDSPGHRALLLAKTWTVMGVELTQRHAAVDFGRQC